MGVPVDMRQKQSQENNIPLETIDMWAGVFDTFDLDGGGTIDTHELKKVIQDMNNGRAPSDAELKIIVDKIDTDKSGDIDFGEFCVFMAMAQKKTPTDWEAEKKIIFDQFDEDGGGQIDPEELSKIFDKLSIPLDVETRDEIFKQFDKGNKGYINWEDWQEMYSSLGL